MGDKNQKMAGRFVVRKRKINRKTERHIPAESMMILGDQDDNIMQGGQDNDTLTAAGGNDILRGDLGDDILDGGDGNDFLDGGDGNDVLYGGQGSNFYCFSKGIDTLNGGYRLTERPTTNPIAKNVLFIPRKLKGSRQIIRGFDIKNTLICVQYDSLVSGNSTNDISVIKKRWQHAFRHTKIVRLRAPHETRKGLYYKLRIDQNVLYIEKTPDLDYHRQKGLSPRNFNIIARKDLPNAKAFIKNSSIVWNGALSLFKSK